MSAEHNYDRVAMLRPRATASVSQETSTNHKMARRLFLSPLAGSLPSATTPFYGGRPLSGVRHRRLIWPQFINEKIRQKVYKQFIVLKKTK